MRVRDDFVPALAGRDLRALERTSGSAFALDPQLTIAYTNAAWDRFAAENRGDGGRWGVGSRLLDAISGPLQAFFAEAYARALHDGVVWHFDYECSSPTIHREFRLTAYPLRHRAGLLVIHALALARPHDRVAADAHVADYLAEGLLHQCSHCRRLRHAHDAQRWDWAPLLVEQRRDAVSHGLCPTCLDHYYPLGVR